MQFSSIGGEGLDALTVQILIECFDESGESGPHSLEGLGLCAILNHCYERGIAYTLTFVPGKGYYLKRGVSEGGFPAEMRGSFDSNSLSGLGG